MTKLSRFIALSFAATVAAAALAIASTSLATAGGYIGGVPGVFKGVPVPNGGFGCGSHCGSGASASSSGGSNSAGGNSGGVYEAPRSIKLACIVGGTPAEFPNDIWVTNTTSATLLAGTKLSFTIPAVGVKGTFLLPQSVPAGKQIKIADIFGGAEAGDPCTVKLVA